MPAEVQSSVPAASGGDGGASNNSNTSRGGKGSIMLKGIGGISDAQNSFSANSPYFSSYVENELASMSVMDDALRDIAARTKTFGKCGALMSESTRRLALACRLQRPPTNNTSEDEKEQEYLEQIREREVAERRRAVGEDMASLLSVMSEVRKKQGKSNYLTLDDMTFSILSVCSSETSYLRVQIADSHYLLLSPPHTHTHTHTI